MNPIPARVLENRRAVAACSAEKAEVLSRGLAALGADVLALPVIATRAIADNTAMRSAVDNLHSYDWIVFTSAHGVRYFAESFAPGSIARIRLPQICAIGPATAAVARECGFSVSLMPEEFVAEGVIRAFEDHYGGIKKMSGVRMLFPRAKEGREILPQELAAAGVALDVVPCYETIAGQIDDSIRASLHERSPDLIVFTSSSTVRNFVALLGTEMLEKAVLAALGPITAKTIEALGRKVHIVPPRNTIESLIEAIGRYFGKNAPPSEAGSQL